MRKEHNTTGTFGEVLRPIASLISKSEKAQQKLAAGTWQYKMLQDNTLFKFLLSKRGQAWDDVYSEAVNFAMVVRPSDLL